MAGVTPPAAKTSQDQLADWERRIASLELSLRPIAKRTPDITDPDWFTKMQAAPHPLDESGTRAAAQGLLLELIEHYAAAEEHTRQAIRRLLAEHSSFTWATGVPFPPTTEAGFRAHLIRFAMEDQGRDARDALLALKALTKEAAAAGVQTSPILRAVADVASDQDKYGMGSTRAMLLAMI